MMESIAPSDRHSATDPETWLDSYGDYLYRYAMLRVHDEPLAEDLVQETLLAALKGRDGFDGRASERTWMTGILKHKVVDQLRRQYRELPLAEEASGNGDEEGFGMEEFFSADGHWASEPNVWNDPAKSAENLYFWEVLQRCIERLAPTQRQLFVLRELHGSSNEEICQDMEITQSNAGVMLYRARVNLRQCLELNWFGLPQAETR